MFNLVSINNVGSVRIVVSLVLCVFDSVGLGTKEINVQVLEEGEKDGDWKELLETTADVRRKESRLEWLLL